MNLIYDTNNLTGKRHAVIDIGSNSVRLVIYLIVGKTFFPIHNEKVLAGLGRGISQTGKLWSKGVELALNSIRRYKLLLDALGVESVDAIATAASRDAGDGKEFIDYIRNEIGIPVRLIDGEMEGRYSAIGVKSGDPSATGIMGDLGGSSLELVDLKTTNSKESFKLGPLALGDIANIRNIDNNINDVRKIIQGYLNKSKSIKLCSNEEFHAVGGAWRNLAQMHMDYNNYPLNILNNYTIDALSMKDFCAEVIKANRKTIEKIKGISQRRAETLPYAALLLSEIITVGKPKKIVISSCGLREGILTDKLGFNEEPLNDGIRAILRLDKYGEDFSRELLRWLSPFLPMAINIDPIMQQKLLIASTLLVNIGMGLHPDHRGQIALDLVARAPFPTASHLERVFLSRVIARRYGEKGEDIDSNPVSAILSNEYKLLADFYGAALRLATSLSGNSACVLRQTVLKKENNAIRIELAAGLQNLLSESVVKRLRQLEQYYHRIVLP